MTLSLAVATITCAAYVVWLAVRSHQPTAGASDARPPGRAAPGRGARLRLARVVRAAARQVVLLRRRAAGVHRVPRGRRLRGRLGRPDRRPGGVRRGRRRLPAPLPRARVARQRARCRPGRPRPLGGARAAHRLRRRRGDRAAGRLLARGPRDPQGAPVGDAPAEGRATPAASCARASSDPTAGTRSSRSARPGSTARPSAGSRWRSTTCARPSTRARCSRSRSIPRVASRASCTSLRCRRPRASRSRRCGACRTRRTA